MKRIFTYLLIIFLFSGCYDRFRSSIPDMPVYMELNLTTTYPTFKNSVNESLVFERPVLATDRIGYGGLLIYSGFDMMYYAFDLACPVEVDPRIKVKPNDLGQAICETCGSVYNISYGIGNPEEGPAKETLRRYKTALQGDLLIIFR